MIKHLLSSTAVIALLAAGPALAADQKAPKDSMKQEQTDNVRPPSSGSVEFVSTQAGSDWLGNSLIGRSVENVNGDKLGDINNLIINENGEITAVVIGVGGFLGIGEKDVGVSFDTLEFRVEQDRTPAADQAKRPANPADQAASDQMKETGAAEKKAEKVPANPASKTNESETMSSNVDSKHSNMVIVLDTTKEELESAPEYAYLGQKKEPKAQ